MADPEITQWLSEHRESLKTLVAALAVSPVSTILPTVAVSSGEIEAADAQLAPRDEVVLMAQTLGEGGMGVVRLGTQTSLQREVAVKSPRRAAQGRGYATKLVQEAWVTSFLEHPNIVPIYDLARDGDGEPMLVMRRIVGVPWGELLDDPDAVRSRFGVADPLEWHLRVLMQLASALHFAHGRKVLHLDLKPANVMIGPLGEVYLVDWGLAMALPDGDPRLPTAAENADIIGTPAYVAPEMLMGDGERLGSQTDVYLLGSTLYTILAGHPPHEGEQLIAILFRVLEGQPDPFPAEVPDEIAAVSRRAMSKDPADRYSSAEEFRLAVQDFLQRRGAMALVASAQERLGEAEDIAASEDHSGYVAALSAARFGFQQALVAWSEGELARVGFDEATARYAIWCAERGDLATADVMAEQLSAPSSEVEAALVKARRLAEEEAARRQELELLEQQLDARTGQRTRLFVVTLLLIASATLPLATLIVPAWANHTVMLAFPLAALGGIVLLVIWGRESLLATRVNRVGMATLVAMFGAQAAVAGLGIRTGLSVAQTIGFTFPVWALAAALFVLAVERRFWPVVPFYVVGTAVTAVHPSAWAVCTTICCLAVLSTAAAVWKPDASVAPADVGGN